MEIVQQLGEELDSDELREADAETRLMGDKSPLDSIALVSLIAEVEARVSETFGRDIILADERAMSSMRSPFRRVGVLAAYVQELLDEA